MTYCMNASNSSKTKRYRIEGAVYLKTFLYVISSSRCTISDVTSGVPNLQLSFSADGPVLAGDRVIPKECIDPALGLAPFDEYLPLNSCGDR